LDLKRCQSLASRGGTTSDHRLATVCQPIYLTPFPLAPWRPNWPKARKIPLAPSLAARAAPLICAACVAHLLRSALRVAQFIDPVAAIVSHVARMAAVPAWQGRPAAADAVGRGPGRAAAEQPPQVGRHDIGRVIVIRGAA
jgi:hypothetical protein